MRPIVPVRNSISSAPANLKAMQDYISKGLMTGAANAVAIPLLFGGTGIQSMKVPFLGHYDLPDIALFFASGGLGQVASDVAHNYLFPLTSNSSKMQNATSTLASLAAYNAVQFPLIGYVGQVTDGRLYQYLAISSLIHYGVEKVYHDVLGQ